MVLSLMQILLTTAPLHFKDTNIMNMKFRRRLNISRSNTAQIVNLVIRQKWIVFSNIYHTYVGCKVQNTMYVVMKSQRKE